MKREMRRKQKEQKLHRVSTRHRLEQLGQCVSLVGRDVYFCRLTLQTLACLDTASLLLAGPSDLEIAIPNLATMVGEHDSAEAVAAEI